MLRRSSYVLTEEGLKKVNAAFVDKCCCKRPSQAAMGAEVGLDSDTIRKLLNCARGVNLNTLEQLCRGFSWNLGSHLEENLHYKVFIPDPLRLPDPPPDPMLRTTLCERYRITEHLGRGEFSETYLAEDLHYPGNPQCVVKRLKSQSSETATREFEREAMALRQLGNHDQIPSLLAYFEKDGDFYLIHQFIEGHDLSQDLIEGQPWIEPQVIELLQDTLNILMFVHQQNVIHRDIKPQNLIRRSSDNNIVLINFGAVKQISTGQTKTYADTDEGYRSPEQAIGMPRLCSDIYAVGILGIQALTKLPPKKLKVDPTTGDIVWRDKAQVSSKLVNILDNMVRYDFKARYPSAAEALQALQGLNTSRST